MLDGGHAVGESRRAHSTGDSRRVPGVRRARNGGDEVSAVVGQIVGGVSIAVLVVIMVELAVSWLAEGLDK